MKSKVWVCCRLLAGIVGSNPAGAWMSVLGVLCCQVEVSASVCSFVQRSPTECGVCECDRESSIKRRPWPTMNCCAVVIQINVMMRVWACVCIDL